MDSKASSPTQRKLRDSILSAIQSVKGSEKGVQALAPVAVGVAADLLQLCRELEKRPESEERKQLARMVSDPEGTAFTTLFTDRVPRTISPLAAVKTGHRLVRNLGIPRYFAKKDQILLRSFATFGRLKPDVAAAAVNRHIRGETGRYLLPDASAELSKKLTVMKSGGIRVNVNHLGEEILSAEEAESHIKSYEALLALPEIDTVSVKISSICQRIKPIALEDSKTRIEVALRRIYRAAGQGKDAKLVMLDMEAFKDLELSVEAFRSVAGEDEFLKNRVGIVLQAYIPDSHDAQQAILQFAKERCKRGGLPIRVRLVKGANLAMEQVLDEQRGWTVPVYPDKGKVDASFKKMLQLSAQPSHGEYLIQGVASHNLFDVALTMLIRSSIDSEAQLSFEILSGMAEPLKRALSILQMPTMVYCPTVSNNNYHTAVAYLVRRLDENTTPGNFLCSGFGMTLGDESWLEQKGQFLEACEALPEVSTVSRRQPRVVPSHVNHDIDLPFKNEDDTDYCVAEERKHLEDAIAKVKAGLGEHLALSIGGEWLTREGPDGFDPSVPGLVPYKMSFASPADIEKALSFAVEQQSVIAAISPRERASWLLAAAQKFREHRNELIAWIMLDGGKIAEEADAEVSEAIDFAEYYARTAVEQFEWKEVRLRPRGPAVIAPPWNFPFAIPLGGCFAALVTGNPAILKPAPESPGVANYATKLCYEAGIPQQFLQLIAAEDEVATPLIKDSRVSTVILTGASDTARFFKRLRPDLHLLAETGGKNTLLITEYADLDAAAGFAADSAFGHSGQKCSAASLLIVQESVLKKGHFLERLAEIANSRRVGSVWDLSMDQGPLIHPPHGALDEALRRSEKGGSEWLLKPVQDEKNPRILRPGICKDVKAGSFLHTTELFGPVVGIMSARDLKHAIELANGTPYGLTSGLMSLDEKEQKLFVQTMDAGNLYVNRATTGAIVRRQPFGGRKTSSFGPGAKAGGPNYTLELVEVSDRAATVGADLPPAVRSQLEPIASWLAAEDRRAFWAAAESYQRAYREEFSVDHDPSGLKSQRNVFRYQPAEGVLLWLGKNVKPLDLALSLAAIARAQVRFDLAMLVPSMEHTRVSSNLGRAQRQVLGQVDAAPGQEELFSSYRRVRCIGEFPEEIHQVKNGVDAYFELSAPCALGRIELLRYFQEQSVSIETHRFGNLQCAKLSPLGHN